MARLVSVKTIFWMMALKQRMAPTHAVRIYLLNTLIIKITPKDEECEKYADSKCATWTYSSAQKLCFLLSSCVEKDEADIISGDKGCKITSSKITAFNLISDKAAKTIKIEWEHSNVCPDVEIAELAALKSHEIKYFKMPDSLKCGKLKKVEAKMDNADNTATVDCTALEDVDAANFYIKTDLADPAACVIETNARIG